MCLLSRGRDEAAFQARMREAVEQVLKRDRLDDNDGAEMGSGTSATATLITNLKSYLVKGRNCLSLHINHYESIVAITNAIVDRLMMRYQF